MSPLAKILAVFAAAASTAVAVTGDMTFYYPDIGHCGSVLSPNDAV
jgi:hypothetical protein